MSFWEICLLMGIVLLVMKFSTVASTDKEIDTKRKISFYEQCVANNVHSFESEKDKQRGILIAESLALPKNDLKALFEEGRKICEGQKQAKLNACNAEMRANESKLCTALNEFAHYTEQGKKIAMLSKEYNEAAKRLRATNDAISMTIAPPLEQEHDWAVMGGLANGLAGPGAGIATAVNAQIENAQIRARNSQLLHETADIRGRILVAGSKQKNALEARCVELNGLINATKTKLVGKDTPKACLAALHFENTQINVSETGTCTINTEVSLKHSYYIFDDVKATIDGTIQGEIYDGNEKIGTANLVLPLDGIPDANMVTIKGMCLFCGQPGKKYTVKFNADNLWAMEQ